MSKENSITEIYAMGRRIGHVQECVFHKSIKPNHYLKKPPAIAFDVESLKDAEQAGAIWVHVKDKVTGVVYKASIAQIWRAGFEFDRGFGLQRALVLSAWTRQGKALQLDLFPKGLGV